MTPKQAQDLEARSRKVVHLTKTIEQARTLRLSLTRRRKGWTATTCRILVDAPRPSDPGRTDMVHGSIPTDRIWSVLVPLLREVEIEAARELAALDEDGR